MEFFSYAYIVMCVYPVLFMDYIFEAYVQVRKQKNVIKYCELTDFFKEKSYFSGWTF